MITLNQKQKIIIKFFNEGKGQRQIHRETGIARDTIRKYINEYEHNKQKLNDPNILPEEKIDIMTKIMEAPKYPKSKKIKYVSTEKVINRIRGFIENNKRKRLNGMRKQQLARTDMHEVLLSEGFTISYPTVCRIVNSLERKEREAFIKQSYAKGDICEFDWGTIKLEIAGILREYQLAVFTSAYGNFRFGVALPKQNTQCFTEAHATFFEKIGGAYKTMVYDNMKVVIKRFVGLKEKEPTDELLRISSYYGFKFRFCNAYRGNEKGHVERSVDVIRRKAFSKRHVFSSLSEANKYLEEICDLLNNKVQKSKNNKTPNQLLEEERSFLLPYSPKYETALIRDLRVTKYSTIHIDSCHYSVPDSLVNCIIRTKIYPSKIICFYENKRIAEHIKLDGNNQWAFNIWHYTKTLTHKPGALANSEAIQQMIPELKAIYKNYFIEKPKEFINLLLFIKNDSLANIQNAINILLPITPNDITLDKIKFICQKNKEEIHSDNIESVITIKSIEALKAYSALLKKHKGE